MATIDVEVVDIAVDVEVVGGTGPAGVAGSPILDGNGPPAPSTGNEGDYYIDKPGHVLYGPKIGSSWPVALRGTPSTFSVGTVAPSNPAVNDIWVDTN